MEALRFGADASASTDRAPRAKREMGMQKFYTYFGDSATPAGGVGPGWEDADDDGEAGLKRHSGPG